VLSAAARSLRIMLQVARVTKKKRKKKLPRFTVHVEGTRVRECPHDGTCIRLRDVTSFQLILALGIASHFVILLGVKISSLANNRLFSVVYVVRFEKGRHNVKVYAKGLNLLHVDSSLI